MAMKVLPVSLGCPKNQVDLEIMLGKLVAAGFIIVEDIDKADIVIVNTCAFIEDAKKEAIESILEMADFKRDHVIKRIIVTGCLAERYKDDIFKELPEVDAVLGIGANGDIVAACYAAVEDNKVKSFPEKDKLPLDGARLLTTPKHYAYLRIADGCSNNCTYCAIPSIRGAFRSRAMENILSEAEELVGGGARELILIAQDVTRYGEDLYGELKLPELLRALCEIEGLDWIRLLYCYPDRITDELLDVMAAEEKILHYLDIPLQHADAKILSAMNRAGDKSSLLALIDKIRDKIPDMVLRTTLITGFPGEDEKSFETLCEFVSEARFEHLGCFAYSKEEGTPAASLPGQVDRDTAVQRSEIVMEQQNAIVRTLNERFIGREFEVIVESYDSYTDTFFGRSYMDAPDIDGQVIFTSPDMLEEGTVVTVLILEVSEEGYDLIGEIV